MPPKNNTKTAAATAKTKATPATHSKAVTKNSASQEDRDDARTKRHLQRLLRSIARKPPYCEGVVALSEDNFTLFYGKEGAAQ